MVIRLTQFKIKSRGNHNILEYLKLLLKLEPTTMGYTFSRHHYMVDI